jgi:branched-chain amino acid transport system substrate-binding protein
MPKVALSIALCASLVFGFAQRGHAESKEIVLGFAVALTGWMNAYDGDSTKMAKLWIDQTNAKGGLLGRKIKWVEADTKTDRTEGAKAGQSVIDQGAELVFVSCDYDFGAPAALQGQKAGVITVFLCASDPKAGVAGVGPLSFSANNAAQSGNRHTNPRCDRHGRALLGQFGPGFEGLLRSGPSGRQRR